MQKKSQVCITDWKEITYAGCEEAILALTKERICGTIKATLPPKKQHRLVESRGLQAWLGTGLYCSA
jgi:hypothetical protein